MLQQLHPQILLLTVMMILILQATTTTQGLHGEPPFPTLHFAHGPHLTAASSLAPSPRVGPWWRAGWTVGVTVLWGGGCQSSQLWAAHS